MIKDNKTNVLEQTIRAIQPNLGSPTERLDIVIQVIAQYIKKKYCSENDITDVLMFLVCVKF